VPAVALLLGAWLARRYAGLYEFAWSHPFVMLIGQFTLLAVGALTRAWTLAAFWCFSGATAYALAMRASTDLRGGLAAAGVAALAAGLAVASYESLRARGAV
jgi:hypothetical protein